MELPKKESILYKKKVSQLVKLKYFRPQQEDESNNKVEEKVYIEDDDEKIENEKLMIKVFNTDKTYDILHEFVMNENRIVDEQQNFNKTKYCSKESHKEFFTKYKNFNEIKRKGKVSINTPSYQFIKACKDQMLVTNPVGLIHRTGIESQINLKNLKVGDNYVKALSQGLRFSDHLNDINLSANRLTFYGVNPLITSVKENKNLLKRLQVMDLSYNKIGRESVEKIISYIKEEENELKELNLEGNSLGDKVIQNLCENIIKFIPEKVTLLNFGKNLISDDCSWTLANIIQSCLNLQVFILCWNHIKNYGGSLIINKLRKHFEMKIFDISWNSIGTNLIQEPTIEDIQKGVKSNRNFNNYEMNDFRRTMNVVFKKYNLPPAESKPQEKNQKNNKDQKNSTMTQNLNTGAGANLGRSLSAFAKELGEYFKETEIALIHLDISHNNISFEDAVHLSQCVKSNHTILGMHVDGNEMYIDSLGFLHPYKKLGKHEDYYANSQIYYQIGKDSKLIKTNIEKVRKIRAKNNCWLCEGWREMDIKFYPGRLVSNPAENYVKLHMNFEDYKAHDTIYSNGCFFNTRMCPPGDIHYFFSIDKKIIDNYGKNTLHLKDSFMYEFEDEYINEFENMQLMHSYRKTIENNDNLESELPEQDHEKSKPSNLNNSKVSNVKNVGCFAVEINRNVVDQYYRKTMKYCEPRPERTFNKFIKPRSPWIFPISIWASFDYKYEDEPETLIDEVFNNDFSRVFGNEKAELKTIIRPFYRKILDSYRILSAQMGSAVWQINATALTDFVNECPQFLDTTYVINDVFVKEREVKAMDKLDKSKGKMRTLPDNLVRHQFLALLVKLASDKYVRTKIYNLPDAVSYSFVNHFEPAFNTFDIHNWRKERYYNEMVDNFIKAHLPILDAVYKSWATNKEPGKRDIWMTLENFNELVLRLVDTESFPVREIPLLFNMSMKLQVDEVNSERHYRMQIYEFFEAMCRVLDKAYPISGDKLSEPLINKIETVLPLLLKSITNPDYKQVKEKFPLPPKEPGSGLYTIDMLSPFYTGFEGRMGKK